MGTQVGLSFMLSVMIACKTTTTKKGEHHHIYTMLVYLLEPTNKMI